MRESVPHLLPPRLLRLGSKLSVLALAALGLASSGCSGKTKGQIILALQTDMSLPEDVTKVKIEVKTNGVSRYDNVFIVDPRAEDPDKIPATLSVVAGEKDNETVELKVVALRDRPGEADEPRTLSKATTTIPTERIALLRVPMQWLCTDNGGDFIDDFGDGEYESACGDKEAACLAGACKDTRINSANLPDWAEELVFGGSENASDGTCFPTEDCFDAGTTLTPDMSDCTVAFAPPNDDIINFAVLAVNGGIRSGANNYVGLDMSRDFGWYELDDGAPPTDGESSGSGSPMRAPGSRRFQLPQGVCDRIADGRATGVRASTDESCLVTKTPRYPTCGPWSSVGKGDEPPVDDDADGDGFGRAVDCDDTDNSIFPGAPERCDELDNNCDESVDNSCVMDLPFSHHVDFSATTTGFDSSPDYAIYQRFDGTTPLDLDQKTVTYAPGPDFTTYTVTTSSLEWDDDLGELVPITAGADVSNCDDCYTSLDIDFPFNFFGTEYQTVYPSSNGYLTFVMGDSEYTESVEYFLAGYPRIAALFSDLDTRSSTLPDEVYYSMTSSKLVVTYNSIQLFSQSGTENTFQFVLFSDGTIKVSYNGMDDLDESSIAGITPGSIGGGVTCTLPLTACYGNCVDLETDVDNCGSCGNVCASSICAAGECAGETVCTQSRAPCDGLCVGSCAMTSEPCDGSCYGTCDGTCETEDGAGGCIGVCDGDCTGDCYLTNGGGACPDACTGSCYVDTAMTCAEPAGTPAGPCTFSGGQVTETTTCYDSASATDTSTSSTYGWSLNCYGDECECCKHSSDQTQSSQVCAVIDILPEDACATEVALRDALLNECMTTSSCGPGCPARLPAAGATCDETEISSCYYPATSNYCFCMGGEFVCN